MISILLVDGLYFIERKIPLCSAFSVIRSWRFLLVKLGHVTVLLFNICAHFMLRRNWFESLLKLARSFIVACIFAFFTLVGEIRGGHGWENVDPTRRFWSQITFSRLYRDRVRAFSVIIIIPFSRFRWLATLSISLPFFFGLSPSFFLSDKTCRS